MRRQVKEQMQSHFRPEFLNRLDETIIFHRLTDSDMKAIIELEISYARERLGSQHITLDLTDDAKTWVLEYVKEDAEDNDYGARPLRRAIERQIEDVLSEDLLAQNIKPGYGVIVTARDGKLAFDYTEGEPPPRKEPERRSPPKPFNKPKDRDKPKDDPAPSSPDDSTDGSSDD